MAKAPFIHEVYIAATTKAVVNQCCRSSLGCGKLIGFFIYRPIKRLHEFFKVAYLNTRRRYF